jgi:predicted amidohydrolase YtcJ
MLDGVIDTGTAWLDEPDAMGAGQDPMWPDPARYAHRVGQFHAAGFRVATHAIGDRAVREVLDAVAARTPRTMAPSRCGQVLLPRAPGRGRRQSEDR